MESEDLIVGITLRSFDVYMHPTEAACYYGYVCCAGKKLSVAEGTIEYGEACVVGDKVGVLLEFDEKEAKLSFYRNSVFYLPLL